MTQAGEAGSTPLAASLAAGVNQISSGQTIAFVRYVKHVLPLDGFVFWVRSGVVLLDSAVYNGSPYDTTAYDQGGAPALYLTSLSAPGSLHFSTTKTQEEAGSPARNSVILTSEVQVPRLNEVGPSLMWVAEVDGVKYAFRERFKFYEQAKLYHYRGDALYSTMASQLVDSVSQLPSEPVVTNSLPIWLALNKYATVYPSFAVPPNTRPPYIACHIAPDATEALQSVPYIDETSSSWQLAQDRVRFTLYGLQNNAAVDFQNYIIANSLGEPADYGILNMPVLRDEKERQVEFDALAQKKTITFEVSYYQARAQQIAQQLIESAQITITAARENINAAGSAPI